MRRRVVVVFAILMSVVVAGAQPAAAASTNLAFGSINSTDSELSNAQTLDGLTVTGSGSAAAVEYRTDSELYDALNDSSDGTVDDTSSFAGDGVTDTPYKTEVEIRPETTDTIYSANVSTGNVVGSDYGASVDVYIATEGADGDYTDGAKVATWDPDWQTGEQQITFDQPYNVTGGELISVQFVTGSSDNDGTSDRIELEQSNEPGFDYLVLGATDSDQLGAISLNGKADTAQYRGAAHSVNETTQGFVNVTAAHNVSYTVEWEAEDGSVLASSTYTTTGNKTDSWSTIDGAAEANVTVSKTGLDPTFELADEGVQFENRHPEIDNSSAAPTGGLQQPNQTFEINVSDPTFGAQQAEELNASLYIDGQYRGHETLQSNGTAAVAVQLSIGGGYDYYWVVDDANGGTTRSQTFSISVPDVLEIRNESNPSEKITGGGSAEVRFFASDGSVYSKPIVNGTVNLTGLPADQQFTAVIDADGYKTRRVIIPSLYEQQTAYVLPDGATSVEVVFEIESPTGQFPPEETTLYVERPLTINNSTQYRRISADTFGATGQYPVDMIAGQRYRLRVESTDGSNSRTLGAFTPVTSTVETLQIQRVEPQSNADAGQVVYGGLTSYANQTAVAVRHRDLGESVDSVEYRIEYGNGTVAVPTTTQTADEFAAVYPLNLTSQSNVTVFYEAQLADGTTVSGSFSTGAVAGPVGRFGGDPQVLSIVSWVAILATMGLLVIVNTDIAPVGGVAVATGLTILGTVAIPLPILGLSGVLAALNAFGGGVGR